MAVSRAEYLRLALLFEAEAGKELVRQPCQDDFAGRKDSVGGVKLAMRDGKKRGHTQDKRKEKGKVRNMGDPQT